MSPEFANGDFPLSMSFTTTFKADEVGTTYFRAHSIVNSKNYWTKERSINVKAPPMEEPTDEPQIQETIVSITAIPEVVRAEESITVVWTISDEEQNGTYTAIHYSFESHQGRLDSDVGPEESGYGFHITEFNSGTFRLPAEFSTTFTPNKTGIIYLRAHAVVNGKHYWSEERTIVIPYT
jgi:hypothetical protein